MPTELRKVLGRRDVLALSFGAMVGWSWVVLAGEMIERAGSLGSSLAFVVGAVMVLLVGLTYAELTSALSRAGGELSFTYLGLGPATSFVCGWILVLAYVAVCAFEAVALPTVFGYLFPSLEGARLYTVAGWDVHLGYVLIGVVGALCIGVINYFGIRVASVFQWSAALVLLAVGASFFIPGNLAGAPENLLPHFTSVEGFLRVVIMTPFLFLGFDVIPQIAEEIKVPFRVVGKLILFSILIALAWYALVQWTVSLTLPREGIGERELPTADAMTIVYGPPWGGRFLVFGGLLGILTSWNAFAVGSSRLIFAMGRGGMLPPVFARLHRRYESPVAALVLITVASAAAPFFGRRALVWLVDAGAFAAVVAYLLVTVAFVRITRRYPALPRPYRAPAPRALGVLAVVTTAFFVVLYLPGSPSALAWPHEWGIVALWAVLGALFYFRTRARTAAMGREAQSRRILGEHAELLLTETNVGR